MSSSVNLINVTLKKEERKKVLINHEKCVILKGRKKKEEERKKKEEIKMPMHHRYPDRDCDLPGQSTVIWVWRRSQLCIVEHTLLGAIPSLHLTITIITSTITFSMTMVCCSNSSSVIWGTSQYISHPRATRKKEKKRRACQFLLLSTLKINDQRCSQI